MTTVERILDECKSLTPALQETVLDFVESLRGKSGVALHDPRGLWAGRGTAITEEDIAAARREMWGGFPREDV